MKYMLMIYESEHIWEGKTDEERRATLKGHGALRARLEADNIPFSGNPLMPTSAATVMKVRNGRREITDGPYAETTEQLAGYYVVDCATLDDALDYAELIPNSAAGSIEIRPVADHS